MLHFGEDKQFFFDNLIIEGAQNLTRRFHKPVKDPRSPLILKDKPWEHVTYFTVSSWRVIRDPEDGLFKCWYEDWQYREPLKPNEYLHDPTNKPFPLPIRPLAGWRALGKSHFWMSLKRTAATRILFSGTLSLAVCTLVTCSWILWKRSASAAIRYSSIAVPKNLVGTRLPPPRTASTGLPGRICPRSAGWVRIWVMC